MNLNSQDTQTLLSAVEHLNSDFNPQTLSARALAAASVIIAADSVAFTGFRHDGAMADLVWDSAGGYTQDQVEVFTAYMHEHPLFQAFISDGRRETLKITDLMPRGKFEQTALYNEFYRRVGVSNQLVTPIPVSDELFVSCSINISGRDFSGRDKLVLSLIGPHLANAIRNAFAYQRLSAALDTEACGIVALNSKGRPVFISEFARLLFQKYFPGENYAADALPDTLALWIKKNDLTGWSGDFYEAPPPFRFANQNGEVTVRLAVNRQTGESTLMLEERRVASPQDLERHGLTRREAEVLFLITQGKSDGVIAIICDISMRTVHKHVEHIYQKLGVETRTSAMLRGLELL
jgi:DNA-binding CsgD family transcriptional regulator